MTSSSTDPSSTSGDTDETGTSGTSGGPVEGCDHLDPELIDSDRDACFVPGGAFLRLANPELPATVSAFYLDRYEVTVGRTRAWLDSLPAPERAAIVAQMNACSEHTWTDEPGPSDALPINCIFHDQGMALCAWEGRRLPTELEWEFAAAGGEEQRFWPFSDPFESEDYDDTQTNVAPSAGVHGFGELPDSVGRWGHEDMAGNVWEYVLDKDIPGYETEPICDDCVFLDPNETRVVRRGGGYTDPWVRAHNRTRDSDPNQTIRMNGLRCAADEP